MMRHVLQCLGPKMRVECGIIDVNGIKVHQGYLDREAQVTLVSALREVVATAPLFRPETARGRKMSVRITSAGEIGWISDRRGYRYAPQHPGGADWPAIPETLVSLWRRLVVGESLPDTCLVNFYGEGARMGMHQDRDEASIDHPVISVSLGDQALLRVGRTTRGGRTASIWLSSGDVAVMGGDARLVFHGIDRIRFGSSNLLPNGGRINVTLRVAR